MRERKRIGLTTLATVANLLTVAAPAVFFGLVAKSRTVGVIVGFIMVGLVLLADWSRSGGWQRVDSEDAAAHEEARNRFERW